MKIDKSRFLLLTTSLAATATVLAVATVACNSTSTSTDAGEQPPSTTPEGGGGGSDGGNTDGGGEQCLGTDGTAPMCSPTGEGGDEDGGADAGATVAKCQFECQSAVSTFKTGVAIAINDCLDKAVADPTVEGACSGALPACATEAIGKACDDTTAAEFCTTTLAACGGGDDAGAADGGGSGAITQDKCVAVAKALSTEGRTTLTTCVSEGALDCGGCFAQASGQPLP